MPLVPRALHALHKTRRTASPRAARASIAMLTLWPERSIAPLLHVSSHQWVASCTPAFPTRPAPLTSRDGQRRQRLVSLRMTEEIGSPTPCSHAAMQPRRSDRFRLGKRACRERAPHVDVLQWPCGGSNKLMRRHDRHLCLC